MNAGVDVVMWIGIVFWWCLSIGFVIILYKALWRFVHAHERIAGALETMGAKQQGSSVSSPPDRSAGLRESARAEVAHDTRTGLSDNAVR
jgi:hypothetical protein